MVCTAPIDDVLSEMSDPDTPSDLQFFAKNGIGPSGPLELPTISTPGKNDASKTPKNIVSQFDARTQPSQSRKRKTSQTGQRRKANREPWSEEEEHALLDVMREQKQQAEDNRNRGKSADLMMKGTVKYTKMAEQINKKFHDIHPEKYVFKQPHMIRNKVNNLKARAKEAMRHMLNHVNEQGGGSSGGRCTRHK